MPCGRRVASNPTLSWRWKSIAWSERRPRPGAGDASPPRVRVLRRALRELSSGERGTAHLLLIHGDMSRRRHLLRLDNRHAPQTSAAPYAPRFRRSSQSGRKTPRGRWVTSARLDADFLRHSAAPRFVFRRVTGIAAGQRHRQTAERHRVVRRLHPSAPLSACLVRRGLAHIEVLAISPRTPQSLA